MCCAAANVKMRCTETFPTHIWDAIVSFAEEMLRDVQKLLGSMHYEYEYWVQDAWVSAIAFCQEAFRVFTFQTFA
jgi:hypothetical protein